MPEAQHIFDFGLNGEPIPSTQSIYALFQQGFLRVQSPEVVGDGNANGTAILIIAVPAGRMLFVHSLLTYTLAAATEFLIVNSDTNGVGGVELVIFSKDQDNNAPVLWPDGPFWLDNRAGVAPRYFMVYAPQARGGLLTNNANTQYWLANAVYKLV